MNVNQTIYDLTYWFDFSMRMVLNHPLISMATVLVAYLFYQAVSTMKLIGAIVSFGLAAAMAIVLKILM